MVAVGPLSSKNKDQCLVQIRKAGKTYRSKRGDVAALKDIDLDIGMSEFVSVLGPSGCGKSTLLRCLAGLDHPTSGEILIGGQKVHSPPDGLGVVFQRDVLLEWRTVLENVLLPVEVNRMNLKEWEPKALELLDLLGLRGFERRHPWELSGGMRQRVSICRALLMNPKLLLMDEPFGALDAMTRDDLNVELQRVWMADEKTVFFVTHSITEAIFLADRVVIMSPSPGRIAEIMTIDLPRPRDLSIRETPEFGQLSRRARTLFQEMGVIRGGRGDKLRVAS
ncbi:MAG: ABC transporter ATP-binding protein [Alphaproteobacteria bacterium]|nr:ABC transporter ATP-binding protein [Alphaproteobacteria bacterium]